MSTDSRSRRAGTGVTTRTIALIMLPLSAMCVLAGSVVLSHRSSASEAAHVDSGVATLGELVAFRHSLHVLQSVAAFNARVVDFGVTPAAATAFLGFDWGAQLAPARAQAEQALAALGVASPVSQQTLQALDADTDSGATTPAETQRRLAGMVDAISGALTRSFDQLEGEAHNSDLQRALRSLQTATGLVDAATGMGTDLSGVMFPSPGATSTATVAVFGRFAAESADYTHAVARLRESSPSRIVVALERVETETRAQAFQRAVTGALAGEPPPALATPEGKAKIAAAFRGYLALDATLTHLVATATSVARDQARQLAASEHARFLAAVAGVAVLTLASVGSALAMARSNSKPLKALARFARAVNEGQVAAEPSLSRSHGPRETRIVFDVVADLATNLRLLDAKANALANCDFDDPVLFEPLPGRLGQSLESSVALLSGSIVERDKLQTHLAHQAAHDSLTGIGNRSAAITAIETAMRRGSRTGATTAVLFFDLNDFKAVNDTHGHEAGDEILRRVAERIKVELRGGDFAARLGGDEFVVVAEEVADVGDATRLAQRILDSVNDPIDIGGIQIGIGAAIGIALSLDGPEEPLQLLARADTAMYRAKRHDRSAIEIFDTGLQRQLIERVDVENALTAALTHPTGGGLQLHYQPVLDAASGELAGAEALIRWDRSGHGMIAPDAFIPIAEASSVVIDLDCWVLNEASRQLREWSTTPGLADLTVAVNISGRHLLSRRLPAHIRAVLDRTGIDPNRLSIEITETVLLADLVAASAELDAVRALGTRVAIDDFGTGYTSLAHLQRLPIDIIKIDRSFIHQLNRSRGNALVQMITDLGHALDVNIVAEGVETPEEMTALQKIGADHLQGYLLCGPIEPNAFATWAHTHASSERPTPTPVG